MSMTAFQAAIFQAVQDWMAAEHPAVPVVYENGPVPDEASIGPIWLDVDIRWHDASNITVGHSPRGRDWGAIGTFVMTKESDGTAQANEILAGMRSLLGNKRLSAARTEFPKRTTAPKLRGWWRTGLLTPFHLDTQGSVGAIDIPESETNDKAYIHTQGLASATWVIVHNLGKYPSVLVEDSTGDEVEGAITYDSVDQMTITFSAAFSGRALLN